MPYAHKLAVLEETPHVKIVYCTICGHENNLSGPCPGEPEFEQNFAKIFGSEPVKISKYLEKVLDNSREQN